MKINRILLIFGISGIIFCGILGFLAIWGSLDSNIVTKNFLTYFLILSGLTSWSRIDKWSLISHKIPVLKEISYFVYLISIIIFVSIGIGLIWELILPNDDFLRKILSSIGLVDFILYLSNSIINKWANIENKPTIDHTEQQQAQPEIKPTVDQQQVLSENKPIV